MERWANKVAVVTGASSGIGKAIAKDLVKHGMKVAALARRIDRLEELEKELNKKDYIKGIKCDITQEDEIKVAISWIESNWGNIHVLVNNAAVAKGGSLTSGTVEHLSEVLETNVIGLCKCTREVVCMMKKHQIMEGHIININSTIAHYIPISSKMYPYATSKHASKLITQLLRTELATHKCPIRVTSISPGVVDTEMAQAILHLDIPRLQPSDVSNCIIYALSTPANVNITELTVQATGEISNRHSRDIFKKEE